MIVDLKESQVHTFIPGRQVGLSDLKKKKEVVDIFTEGKEVLEHRAFVAWMNRTRKLGSDILGCDNSYRRQHGGVVGDMDDGEDESCGEDGSGGGEERSVEYDVEADLEQENEI